MCHGSHIVKGRENPQRIQILTFDRYPANEHIPYQPALLSGWFSFSLFVGRTVPFFGVSRYQKFHLPSRSLTARPWKVTFPIGKDRLPTTIFQGRTVKPQGCTSLGILINWMVLSPWPGVCPPKNRPKSQKERISACLPLSPVFT